MSCYQNGSQSLGLIVDYGVTIIELRWRVHILLISEFRFRRNGRETRFRSLVKPKLILVLNFLLIQDIYARVI